MEMWFVALLRFSVGVLNVDFILIGGIQIDNVNLIVCDTHLSILVYEACLV